VTAVLACMLGISEGRDQEGKLKKANEWYDHSSLKEVRKAAISDEATKTDHVGIVKTGALKTIDEIKKIAKKESDEATHLHHKESQPGLQRFSGWSNKKQLLDGWKLEHGKHKIPSPPLPVKHHDADGSSFFLKWGDQSSTTPTTSTQQAHKQQESKAGKAPETSPLSMARKALALERMKRRKREADLLDKASKSAESILDRKAKAQAQAAIARQTAYQNVVKKISQSHKQPGRKTTAGPSITKEENAKSESQRLAFERLKLRKMIYDLQRVVGAKSAKSSGQDASKLSATMKAMNKIEGILAALKKKLSSLHPKKQQASPQPSEQPAGSRGRTMTDKGKEAKAANTHATSSTSDEDEHQDWMRKKEKKWEEWMPIPGFGEKKSWLLKRTP